MEVKDPLSCFCCISGDLFLKLPGIAVTSREPQISSFVLLSPLFQFSLQGCVLVGVCVTVTTVPTDPPAPTAAVPEHTMPCAPSGWDSSPWASSWSCGLSFPWTGRRPAAPPRPWRSTPPSLATMMRIRRRQPSPRQWPWCWLRLGRSCWFYPFVWAWGTRGGPAPQPTRRPQQSSSQAVCQGSRRSRESF